MQFFETLSPATDIFGAAIEVGSRVRSFDFPHVGSKGDLWGFDETGERACWVDGIVEAIGEDVREGCPRYRIAVVDHMLGGKPLSEGRRPSHIFPPANGTRIIGSSIAPTMGVVALAGFAFDKFAKLQVDLKQALTEIDHG